MAAGGGRTGWRGGKLAAVRPEAPVASPEATLEEDSVESPSGAGEAKIGGLARAVTMPDGVLHRFVTVTQMWLGFQLPMVVFIFLEAEL